jgi:hypothetical protein
MLMDMNSYVSIIFTDVNITGREQYLWIPRAGGKPYRGVYIDVDFLFPLTYMRDEEGKQLPDS